MSTLKLSAVQNVSGTEAFTIESNGRVNMQRMRVPVFNGTPSSPVAGELIFNSSTGKMSFYTGSEWK
tara:strand:- start:1374 stop:1574 length:201 start_codon:yes stop_codon:yes gene_type:complete